MSAGPGPLDPVRRAGRTSALAARSRAERLAALSARAHVTEDGRLSQVQTGIVRMIADGLTDAQIAARMRWTEQAVSAEVARSRARVGALNRAHLVAVALRRKLID